MHARSTASRFLFISLVALGPACTKEDSHNVPSAPVASAPAPSAPTPSAPAPHAGVSASAPTGDSVSGTVVETMDAGGYTYARLDNGTQQVWVAGPETKLAVGTKIGAVSGTLMPGFRSNSLNRTFDQIYFIGSYPVAGGAPANPHTGSGGMTQVTPAVVDKIAPAAGGQTIAAVYAGKAGLTGKPVIVRGKVVKVNSGILGRNWIHLQDGTGAAGTNDLLITTDAAAAPAVLGNVVVARGTLVTDKDFGSGYKYDVLVEGATLAAQ